MNWLVLGVVVLLLCCPSRVAAWDQAGRAEGAGGEAIPPSLRQWTKDVMLLEKQCDQYVFLSSNLNRTFAISQQLPSREAERMAGAAEAVRGAVANLAASWQKLDAVRVPARYAGAVAAWERKIGGIRAAMETAVCGYCGISAASPAGDAPDIDACAGNIAEDCASGGCLACCDGIPDTSLQRLCAARCQHHAALCLLGDAITRHSRGADAARP